MRNLSQYLVNLNDSLNNALAKLNALALATDPVVFVVDENNVLIGSLSDGDVRRGLIKGKSNDSPLIEFLQLEPNSIVRSQFTIQDLITLRKDSIRIFPVIDEQKRVVDVIDSRHHRSYLPLDAVIMAGGLGSRLKPLTDTTPKPLLKVGNKSIIDHNIDRLISFGVDNFHISIRYLGKQIEDHYKARSLNGIDIDFIWEDKPLGTVGAVSLIEKFKNEYILISNSDILTTLDYEDFLLDFIENDADISVATVPFESDVPYAVLETSGNDIISFKEKPTYTYYCNGGIYLVKKSILNSIPKESFYNSTDLMQDVISNGGKIISFPIRGYWLDIGKHEDFEKANRDIKFLDL